jgi:hypothetical protein
MRARSLRREPRLPHALSMDPAKLGWQVLLWFQNLPAGGFAGVSTAPLHSQATCRRWVVPGRFPVPDRNASVRCRRKFPDSQALSLVVRRACDFKVQLALAAVIRVVTGWQNVESLLRGDGRVHPAILHHVMRRAKAEVLHMIGNIRPAMYYTRRNDQHVTGLQLHFA